MHCSVIVHGMTSLSFQTAIQKNEAKLSSLVQFENVIVFHPWLPKQLLNVVGKFSKIV